MGPQRILKIFKSVTERSPTPPYHRGPNRNKIRLSDVAYFRNFGLTEIKFGIFEIQIADRVHWIWNVVWHIKWIVITRIFFTESLDAIISPIEHEQEENWITEGSQMISTEILVFSQFHEPHSSEMSICSLVQLCCMSLTSIKSTILIYQHNCQKQTLKYEIWLILSLFSLIPLHFRWNSCITRC